MKENDGNEAIDEGASADATANMLDRWGTIQSIPQQRCDAIRDGASKRAPTCHCFLEVI